MNIGIYYSPYNLEMIEFVGYLLSGDLLLVFQDNEEYKKSEIEFKKIIRLCGLKYLGEV